MSDAPAVFQATFADWRTVKGRKQLQIILECPIEQQGEILSILGAPNPSNPAWVAIAVLNKKAVEAQASKETKETGKRRWDEIPLAARAGMLCEKPPFWRFLEEENNLPLNHIGDADQAALHLRELCGVQSRSEFDTVPSAGEAFRNLNSRFDAWFQV